jgi:hypothetical protein
VTDTGFALASLGDASFYVASLSELFIEGESFLQLTSQLR